MSALATIYNFEGAIQQAAVDLLVAGGLAAFGPDDEIDFTKDRPRVEVASFTVNGANDSRQFICPDGVARHDTYSGTLTLAIITDTKTDDQAAANSHNTYRATVRAVMSGILSASLTDLELRYCTPQGSTTKISPQENMDVSNLTYELRFAIKTTAWPT